MFSFYVMYECATWSTILREEQYIFRLYDNRSQKAKGGNLRQEKRGS